MSAIDPAECLLATIGIRPILSKEVEAIPPEAFTNAAALPSILSRSAYQLARGHAVPVTQDFDSSRYFRTLMELTVPYQPGQVEAMLLSFPPGWAKFKAAFLGSALNAYNYLSGHLPRQIQRSVHGPHNIKPPQSLLFKFEELLWICDRPQQAFSLMQSGIISDGQLDALRNVYPSLTAFMDSSLRQNLARTPHQVHRYAERAIARFLGVPLSNPQTSIALSLPAPKPDSQPERSPVTPARTAINNTKTASERINVGAQ